MLLHLIFVLDEFLGERYYVTFALSRPSVCRLSATLLRRDHRVVILGTIFAPCNSLGTRAV